MAAVGQHWEVVSKPTKKSKQNGHSQTGSTKKAPGSNVPRIESAQSSTIYDAFVEKERKAQQKLEKAAAAKLPTTPKKSRAQKKTEVKREKPPTLEELIKKIEIKELQAVLERDQVTFPENESIWLKDLASVLNLQLEKAPESDPVYSGHPADYPSNLLTNNVQKVLTSTLHKCSSEMIELFFEHCLQTMVADIAKGIPTHGYRIYIQLIAMRKPEIILAKNEKHLDLLKKQPNSPLRCLSIMWAIGQAGTRSIHNGMKVWLEVLLPVMNIRSLSAYVVEYLDTLLINHKNLKPAYNCIGFRNFFPIFDLIFSANQSLAGNLQKKLKSLYPKLKEISFGGGPETNLRNFFPSFLARLSNNSSKALKSELLDCLVTCLTKDTQCFSVWRQMYTKQLTQSSILLEHILTRDRLRGRLEKKLLQETIGAFHVTNEELSTQGHNKVEGLHSCVRVCKLLQVKMSKVRFPWRSLLMFILTAIIGVIAYDVYLSGTFKKSKTANYLKDAGVLVYLEQAWKRICFYSNKSYVWLGKNVPYYYSRTCDLVGPYLALCWEKIYQFGLFLAEVTKPQRDWLAVKIPLALEWVQSKVPFVTDACCHYGGIAWKFIVEYSLWLWQVIVYYANIAGMWLQENVFTGRLSGENLHKTMIASLTTIQSYSASAVQWVTERVSGK